MVGQDSLAPRAALTAPPGEDSAFVRLWRGFSTARITIAVVLLTLLAALFMLGPADEAHSFLLGLCATYLAATFAVRLFKRPPTPGLSFDPQWVSTIGVDLVMFSSLQFLQAGGINFAPLFAVPVLMASVLGSPLLAFGTAAGVTLLLLNDAWLVGLQSTGEIASRSLQAGLSGTGYFALAFLANQLAQRLAGEEKTARRSQQAARAQAQVNELVIETLTDGVLVVDPAGKVQAVNPAGRSLLGCEDLPVGAAFELAARTGWSPLVALSQLTFTQGVAQLGEVILSAGETSAQRVFVRTRLTAAQDHPGDSLCVMFLEDLREMEARLRNDKLLAMGRMSAAVAHEIRNPLAAITQANALLAEDLTEPGQRQLNGLVAQNARRLAQIVEDILDISRIEQQQAAPETPVLELDAEVATTCADWSQQAHRTGRLYLDPHAGAVRVPFAPDHLRRVMVNLLDNALRYASARPRSIQVATSATGPQAGLVVWSDGPPLEPTVERHLFEPFFSSESRSTGLGLYICRELCERHGALIGYRRCAAPDGTSREGNEFFVSFRPTPGRLADAASFATIAA